MEKRDTFWLLKPSDIMELNDDRCSIGHHFRKWEAEHLADFINQRIEDILKREGFSLQKLEKNDDNPK